MPYQWGHRDGTVRNVRNYSTRELRCRGLLGRLPHVVAVRAHLSGRCPRGRPGGRTALPRRGASRARRAGLGRARGGIPARSIPA